MSVSQNIAVVGSGISGLTAAHALQSQHRVTVFEADQRLGGHTDTHDIVVGDKHYSVDSGFIVFNTHNYPNFNRWLTELGVASRASDMSFSVRSTSGAGDHFEYGTSDLAALFAQRRNLVSPAFWKFLFDLRSFYRSAHAAADLSADITLGQFVQTQGYGRVFVDEHLVPMCSALWSQPTTSTLDIPIRFIVQFMQHHLMLQISERPQWQVVEGGSSSYLREFERSFNGRILLREAVQKIRRQAGGVQVTTRTGTLDFDAVFLACHSDQALLLLDDPSPLEQDILSRFTYQENTVLVHSDASVMPINPKAWSSWNALTGHDEHQCQVTYWMNRLQGFAGDNFFVTLNPTRRLEQEFVRRQYAHPIITSSSVAAQSRKHEIDGVAQTYFCGAYWGWGFHEDGVNSALSALNAFNLRLANAA